MTTFYEFPNGFRIVHQKPINNLNITSIQCVCDIGSVYENDQTRGSSHFIEHMCFKGTNKIPVSEDIFKKYDEIGALFNAFTDKRYTCYYIKCNDEYITNCLIILSDMLLNSIFNKKEYDKELQVVIQENIKNNDKTSDIISDIIDEMIYKGTSFEKPVDHINYHSSTKHNKPFNYESILDIYKSFYRPKNIILSIVSNISFENILKIINKTYFIQNNSTRMNKSIKVKYSNCIEYGRLTPQHNAQYIVHKKKGCEINNLAISFRTCSQYNDDKHCLELLKTIIGDIYNSKMFVLLRQDNGLTYSSYVTTDYNEISGFFTLNAITDPTKLIHNGNKKGVLPLIVDLLNRLIENGITREDLIIAKKYKKGKLSLDLENNDVSALYNAEHLLLYANYKYISYDNYYDGYYNNIKLKEINNVMRKYFKKTNLNVCLLGDENTITENKLKTECEKMK